MSIEFLFQFFDNLLTVFSLSFRFTGVVAEDVAAPEFAVSNHHLPGMEVFRDNLIAAGLHQHLFLDFRHAAHAGGKEILPTSS